jgi:hypothetical protein
MKKYLFGMLAIVLAITFSAFKKAAPETLAYVFTLQSSPISTGVILANDGDFFTNWEKTGTAVTACDISAEEKACSIVVDAKYTTTSGSDILLNFSDPDDSNPTKAAFPMSATTGLNNGTQYYKVNTTEVGSEIDVRNGTVN